MKYILIFILFFFTSCSYSKNQNKIIKINNNISKIKTPKEKYLTNLDFEQNISILPKFDDNLNINFNYKKKFFYPYNVNLKNIQTKNLSWFEKFYKSKEFYFFNKQKIPFSFFEEIFNNANMKNFGKINKKAIIIKNSFLKNIPTKKNILQDPFKDGEGIPFDYAQDGVLNAGLPVLISHYSKDKKFAFILCEYGFGFVDIKDLEIFTNKRAKIYEKLNFITPIKEQKNIYDINGNFLFESRIGALYPYYKEDKKYFYGKIGKNKYKILKNIAKTFPLKLNDKNLKNQLQELFNKPYGWGGYDLERDCSLFLRDLFASFGIYLPRNSYSQSIYFKNYDISNLNNEKKQELINKFAKKYLTLLYMKGHIVLYVGNINHKNAIMHSIWGIKTKNDERLLISKNVISSLTIGEKNENVNKEDLLISRLKTITFIQIDKNDDVNIQEFIKNNMLK